MKKIYEYGSEKSSKCMHCWVKRKVGMGYHQFCLKCGAVKITSGVIPTVETVQSDVR